MVDPKAMAGLLYDAADIIDVRGHAKGEYVGEYGEVCIYGAFNLVQLGRADWFPGRYLNTEQRELRAAVNRQLARSLPDSVLPPSLKVIVFNESSSHEEVTDLLRNTADRIMQSVPA